MQIALFLAKLSCSLPFSLSLDIPALLKSWKKHYMGIDPWGLWLPDWNSLPTSLCSLTDAVYFKKNLKTILCIYYLYLYCICFLSVLYCFK
jgi:hypothetical protein